MAAAISLSAVAHLGVFAYMANLAPPMTRPLASDENLPELFVPVIILPRALPAKANRPRPLTPRMARLTPHPVPVAPLIVPTRTPPLAASARTGPVDAGEGLRRALRGGAAGCANLDALDAPERERCRERLGRDSRQATYIPPAVGGAKQAEFDRAAALKAAAYKARETPLGTGNTGPFVKPSDYDGEPHITGAGASAIGQATHPSSKRAAPTLERMKP